MSTKEKNSQPTRRRYTRAFKLEAVELVERGDQPVATIARALGVKREVLYSWRDVFRKRPKTGTGIILEARGVVQSALGSVFQLSSPLPGCN